MLRKLIESIQKIRHIQVQTKDSYRAQQALYQRCCSPADYFRRFLSRRLSIAGKSATSSWLANGSDSNIFWKTAIVDILVPAAISNPSKKGCNYEKLVFKELSFRRELRDFIGLFLLHDCFLFTIQIFNAHLLSYRPLFWAKDVHVSHHASTGSADLVIMGAVFRWSGSFFQRDWASCAHRQILGVMILSFGTFGYLADFPKRKIL